MTARRSGFGMPFLLTLPSSASQNIVSISCLNPSAGVTSQTKSAISLADVLEPVRHSRRDEDPVAGLRDERLLAEPELELTCKRTSKSSSCAGWTWAAATAPFGSTKVSTTTRSPFVSAEVVRKTRVSPVTRFRDGLAGGDHCSAPSRAV